MPASSGGHLVSAPARIDPTNPAFTKVRDVPLVKLNLNLRDNMLLLLPNHLKSKQW